MKKKKNENQKSFSKPHLNYHDTSMSHNHLLSNKASTSAWAKRFSKSCQCYFFYFMISLGGECGFSFEQISPKDVRCQFWVKVHGPLVMQKMKLSRKNKITKSSMSSTISAIKILHFGETSNRPLVIFIQSLDGNILIKSIISFLKNKVESNMKKNRAYNLWCKYTHTLRFTEFLSWIDHY